MTPPDIALVLAGAIGSGVSVVHGVLTQKLMFRPFKGLVIGDARISAKIHRLVWALLHFSTVSWFAGGILLIALSFGFAPHARAPLSIFVGALFLYGVAGNLWGTRSWHPGWILMTIAVGLIAYSVA